MGLVIVIIIIVYMYNSKSNKGHKNISHTPINNLNNSSDSYENEIEKQIKEKDKLFNKEEFLAFAKNLFIKFQYAWTDRNLETIRCFETNELFEQHLAQIKRYIDNNEINVLERVSVNWAKLYKFEQVGDKDVLSITLNSKMIDYIIDANTKAFLSGSKIENKFNTYKLTFIRKTGVLTKPGESTINTTNCPNCGAPTKITSSGKCDYCGSVITTGEYNWVLSNLEKFSGF
jgi:hypothetical protein